MDTTSQDSESLPLNITDRDPSKMPVSKAKRAFWWSFAICSLLTAILILANRNSRMINVDREKLTEAKASWKAAQIDNYQLEVSVTTSHTDTYQVTVADGKAVQVLLNGNSLHRRHAFDTWTITGMLETIAIDIEHCERWDAGRAMPGTCDLMIKANLDSELGIPVKYIRMELGRPSNVGVMDWEITRFEPS